MPSSIIENVTAMPLKVQAKPKINLIAWDPESPAHCERMVQQRIACGWKQNYVEKWRILQREGKMALQWIKFDWGWADYDIQFLLAKQVLSGEDPEKETKLAQHVLEYPGETAPILDTATTLGGKPRIPSLQSFLPVGHISLDAESPNADQADASRGLYCITTFYVSRALHGCGLGRAAMDTIESEAVNEPLYAKILSLDTFANYNPTQGEMWAKIGTAQPSLSNQDWYERRGYKVWTLVEGHIQHRDPEGRVWPLNAVFMKKAVA